MGFFSHQCSISRQSIPAWPYANLPKKASDVVLVLPCGDTLKGIYNGYGVLEGSGEDRNLMKVVSDSLVCTGLPFEVDETEGYEFKTLMDNIKWVRSDLYTGQLFEDLERADNCEYQGYFYPSLFRFRTKLFFDEIITADESRIFAGKYWIFFRKSPASKTKEELIKSIDLMLEAKEEE